MNIWKVKIKALDRLPFEPNVLVANNSTPNPQMRCKSIVGLPSIQHQLLTGERHCDNPNLDHLMQTLASY